MKSLEVKLTATNGLDQIMAIRIDRKHDVKVRKNA